MTAVVRFTPLVFDGEHSPFSYLLEVDECRILLDCGWGFDFQQKQIEMVLEAIPTIDVVLITHSSLSHIGALPYLVKRGLKAPIYCTIPVHDMGLITATDALRSHVEHQEFSDFGLDDITVAFAAVTTMKYSQPLQLTGNGSGITVTPFSAGHLLGGAVWKISKETEDVVYAVDWDHKREHHLSGSLLEILSRPSLLITDSRDATTQPMTRKQRGATLLDSLVRTIRQKGHVLLPVDPAGRILETLFLLDQFWSIKKMADSAHLVILSHNPRQTLENARSSLEWMGERMAQMFETKNENPFTLPNVKLCTSVAEVEFLSRSLPVVCLASGVYLEPSLALDLFCKWATSPANLILLSETPVPNTASYDILKHKPSLYHFKSRRRVLLTEEELARQAVVGTSGAAEPSEESNTTVVEEAPEMPSLSVKSAFTDVEAEVSFYLGEALEEANYSSFSYKDRKVIMTDTYGEVEDMSCYMDEDQKKFQSESAENEDVEMAVEEAEEQTDPLLLPAKYEQVEFPVAIKAQSHYVDLEGRADGKSIRTVVSALAPRRVVLVHGSSDSLGSLRQHCIKSSLHDVNVPSQGEVVKVTSDSLVSRVRVHPALLASLQFQQFDGGYSLAIVNATVRMPEEEDVIALENETGEPEPKRQRTAKLPELVVVETAATDDPLLVGETKLSTIKEALAKREIQATFKKGVLACGAGTVVSKPAAEEVVVEGSLGSDFFQIRDTVYDQLSWL